MSNRWGTGIRLSLFGESHSKAIGMVIDGIPAGTALNMEGIGSELQRRAPGRNSLSSPRQESDRFQILSGCYQGSTTGTPLSILIFNEDTRSQDYEAVRYLPRPSHADYTGYMKYGSAYDFRDGGHFSGRLTAPLVFAGAVCRQLLAPYGIEIGSHVQSLQQIEDSPLDTISPDAVLLKP